jgi:hypothetical protein
VALPISPLLSPSLITVASVASAARTAAAATLAASAALRAISRMEAFICSMPAATAWALPLTCSAADDTRPAWADVSSALPLICWLTAASSSDEHASASAVWPMGWTVWRIDPTARLRASLMQAWSPR